MKLTHTTIYTNNSSISKCIRFISFRLYAVTFSVQFSFRCSCTYLYIRSDSKSHYLYLVCIIFWHFCVVFSSFFLNSKSATKWSGCITRAVLNDIRRPFSLSCPSKWISNILRIYTNLPISTRKWQQKQ